MAWVQNPNGARMRRQGIRRGIILLEVDLCKWMVDAKNIVIFGINKTNTLICICFRFVCNIFRGRMDVPVISAYSTCRLHDKLMYLFIPTVTIVLVLHSYTSTRGHSLLIVSRSRIEIVFDVVCAATRT